MNRALRTQAPSAFVALAIALSPFATPLAARAMGPLAPNDAGRSFGLGVVLGDPTGVTGETWLARRRAFDFAAAWSMDEEDSMDLTADHLWYDFGAVGEGRHALAAHYGIGGRLGLRDRAEDRVGARIPVGLTYFADEGRVGIYLQVAPVVDLAPDTELDFQAGLGARYFLP